MAEYVDFHYLPLEGKISGMSMLKQTEDAINDLGEKVYSLDIDSSLIDEAIETSEMALNIAESALSAVTTGRSVWFNNVAEMIVSPVDIGVVAETKGYYLVNDGGGAVYIIRQKSGGDVVDGGSIIQLADEDMVAQLVTDGSVDVKQFGAKGNGVDDDSTAFQNTSTYAQTNGFTAFVAIGTYNVTGTITGTFNSFGEVTIVGGGTVDIVNLHDVVDDVTAIKEEVESNTESAQASAESASNSAESAADSATDASITLSQLIAYLDTKEEITAPIVDPTLTISGAAADAQVVGEKFAEDEADFKKYVKDKYQDHNPLNWFDKNDADVGLGNILADGTIDSATNRSHTGYIPVDEGDVLRFYYNATGLNCANAAVYDRYKTVVPAKGITSSTYSFTVPSGIKYIRISYDNTYESKYQVTKNYVPTGYNTYFTPYTEIAENFITPATEEVLSNPAPLLYETAPNQNIVLNSDNGAGAYYASGGKMKFDNSGSYGTSFRYAVVKLKPNTDYSVKAGSSFRWWGFTKNGVVTSSGSTNKVINGFNSGDNDTVYLTISNSSWSDDINDPSGKYPFIVAEGYHGSFYHEKNLVGANGLSQNNMLGMYSCTMPKTKFRLTQNIPVEIYQRNALGLEKNFISFNYSNKRSITDKKKITIDTSSTMSDGLQYTYAVYDDNMYIVERLERTACEIYADNLQNCSVLMIGDSTVDSTAQKLNDNFNARSKTVTLLGTQGTSPAMNEGRPGWSAGDYCGASARGQSSSNAFWNPGDECFDFTYYMTQQGYASVDFVVVQLGTNDLYGADINMDSVKSAWTYIEEIIDSILTFNSSQKIILNLPVALNTNLEQYGSFYAPKNALFRKYDEYAIYQTVSMKYYSKIRTSIAHLMLDPETDIRDTVHPTDNGYNKIALATLNEINCWQNV